MAILELAKGDITTFEVDAIVNAANSRLAGGGGVDGAIHRAAGPKLLEACQKIYRKEGECKSGNAVITAGYLLKAKYVIHTVGPIWRGANTKTNTKTNKKTSNGNEAQTLAVAYANTIQLACRHSCQSLAFPNISTGVYGFPKQLAAEIAIATLQELLAQQEAEEVAHFTKLYLVCFDQENYDIYRKLLEGN